MPIAPNKFEKGDLPDGGGGIDSIIKGKAESGSRSAHDAHDKDNGKEQSHNKQDEAVPGVIKVPLTKIKARGHGPVVFDFQRDPDTGGFRKVEPQDQTQQNPTK